MIVISDKTRCSGCTACMNSCPVACISMREDNEGFMYPSADVDACVGCGKCEDVCPYNNPVSDSVPSAYAVRSSYEAQSSSGGALSALTARWLEHEGCVYGAAFDSSLDVVCLRADDNETADRFRTSKYVQSSLDDTFSNVRNDIAVGRKVLFVGTPCQVAGLNAFLGNMKASVVTVQLACHGVPPSQLWKSYLSAMEKKTGKKIFSVNFRDKSDGWKSYNVAYKSDSRVIRIPFNKDTYMLAYLQNLSLRPSCYECRFRSHAYADLTAGDLWNAPEMIPEHDDGKGFTLIAVNTPDGAAVLEELRSTCKDMLCIPIDYARAVSGNEGFGTEIRIPEARTQFFDSLYTADDTIAHMEKFVSRRSGMSELYGKIHSCLYRIKKKIKA